MKIHRELQHRELFSWGRILWLSLWVLLSSLGFFQEAWASFKISPQYVVDRTLSEGLGAKQENLTAQKSYIGREEAQGKFDWLFKTSLGYNYSEAESISGTTDPLQRAWSSNATFSKTMNFGLQASLAFDYLGQNNVLSAYSATLREPEMYQNVLTLGLRQPLWRDSFGVVERNGVTAAQLTIESALETREENLEGQILKSVTLFWNTYIAQQQLKENISAREKYEELVRNARRKTGYNLNSPGELPRLEAEFSLVDQRVKKSSADYLNALDSLMVALRLENKDEVELEVPASLPAAPKLTEKDVTTLRAMRTAQKNLEAARVQLRSTKSSNDPRLDLVAKVQSSGVDKQQDRSFAEMSAGRRPTYFVGAEFEMPLDSSVVRARETDKALDVQKGEVSLEQVADAVKSELLQKERSMVANYTLAKLADETVDKRRKVVAEIEASYRQGRQPLVELIRAYNDLFSAQLDRARAIGSYHISLNELAAARDELVMNIKN